MPDAVFIAAVLGAGLACPAMMWVSNRRGRAAPCCPPGESPKQKLDRLKAEQEQLDERIAALQGRS